MTGGPTPKAHWMCNTVWHHLLSVIKVLHHWPYLWVFHLNFLRLPVNDAERDALWLRGEDPADGRAAVAHGNRDGAVAAGLDEELPGTVPELSDVVQAERDGHAESGTPPASQGRHRSHRSEVKTGTLTSRLPISAGWSRNPERLARAPRGYLGSRLLCRCKVRRQLLLNREVSSLKVINLH